MKLANPAPLGLTGFALTTWMLSMVNAGWFTGASVPLVLASAFAFGGTAQFVAGLMEMPRGNTFGFVAFCSYGAFWWSFALFVQFFATNVPRRVRRLVAADVGRVHLLHVARHPGAEPRRADGVSALWITFFLLGGGRSGRHAVAARGGRLHGAGHRGARLLPGGRRGDQRDPRPHSAADRRCAAPGARVAGLRHLPA